MRKDVYTGCCGSTEEQSGLLLEEVEMGAKVFLEEMKVNENLEGSEGVSQA